MKWEELFKNKTFITDLRENQRVEDGEGSVSVVGRYAVWSPMKNSNNHCVIEVGDNLDFLKNKYNISDDRICILSE